MKEFLITMAWGVLGVVAITVAVAGVTILALWADKNPWVIVWVCIPVVVTFYTFLVGCAIRAVLT